MPLQMIHNIIVRRSKETCKCSCYFVFIEKTIFCHSADQIRMSYWIGFVEANKTIQFTMEHVFQSTNGISCNCIRLSQFVSNETVFMKRSFTRIAVIYKHSQTSHISFQSIIISISI